MSHNLGTVPVPVKVYRRENAKDLPLPSYKTAGAAGMDLYAAIPAGDAMTLLPGRRTTIPTGLHVAIPEGYEAQVRARSGLALKHGIAMVNGPGTIDSDYRGEICVLIINTDREESFQIRRGDRIAQLIVAPVSRVDWDEVKEAAELEETARGTGGFGSTGQQ